MHILDIAQNSLAAGAKTVEMGLALSENMLTITVADDGRGMDAETAARAADPFSTSRSTRKVGMGLPLLKFSAESAGGSFGLKSQPGKGTEVTASYSLTSLNRVPLGDLAGTVAALIQGGGECGFKLRLSSEGESFSLDTREIREQLGGLAIEGEALEFVREYVEENSLRVLGNI